MHGQQFGTAAELIKCSAPHEHLSEHGEDDDEVHNRAMDTSARPRVSCMDILHVVIELTTITHNYF